MTAESWLLGFPLTSVTAVLQWSRGQMTAESKQMMVQPRAVSALQWSRGRMTAERQDRDGDRPHERLASMEPRSDDRGED